MAKTTKQTPAAASGYHDCPCRDCFEIAIGTNAKGEPALCHGCETAGCAGCAGECSAEHAYGGTVQS